LHTTSAVSPEQQELRARREAVVHEHMQSENELDFDRALGTFDHPRYELIALGQVFDGREQVAEYYRTSRTAFPDQRNENVVLRHADDAVIVEFDLRGTHLGEFLGFAPTGREFTCRMVALFLFEGDRIVCERIYFDLATIVGQLGLLGQVAQLAEQLTGTQP
jgi:steroid delta-isomerase-like uncharacterized protein